MIGNPDHSILLGLDACFTDAKFDSWIMEQINTIGNVLFSDAQQPLGSIVVSSTQWKGYQMQSRFTNVNVVYQTVISNSFIQLTDQFQTLNCQYTGKAMHVLIPIVIIILGLLVVCCGALLYFRRWRLIGDIKDLIVAIAQCIYRQCLNCFAACGECLTELERLFINTFCRCRSQIIMNPPTHNQVEEDMNIQSKQLNIIYNEVELDHLDQSHL